VDIVRSIFFSLLVVARVCKWSVRQQLSEVKLAESTMHAWASRLINLYSILAARSEPLEAVPPSHDHGIPKHHIDLQ
jgi:hypothetical protein